MIYFEIAIAAISSSVSRTAKNLLGIFIII